MPPILSKPSKAAHMAIAYVTVGALVMVWNTIWYLWMSNHQPEAGQPRNDAAFYWCAAFFFSGLTLFVIGLALGRIGRSARKAELPPEVAPGQPTAQPAVAAPPVAAPLTTNGQPVAVSPTAAVPPVAPTAPVR